MRPATPGDFSAIKQALSKLLALSPAPKMKLVDYGTALDYIYFVAMPQQRVWIVHGYMVMFDIGRDWYIKDDVLIEQMIIRVYSTTRDVADAALFLEQRAAALGLRAVISGDTQIGLMAPVYLSLGYQPMGTQFIKEVASGISPQAHRSAGAN